MFPNANNDINVQAFEHLQSFVAEADRKTELAKKRLAETQEELSSEVTNKVSLILLKLLYQVFILTAVGSCS